ncbi:MAG: GDYXXLXY domain-containing protein [Endomicrobia bacterium]|nr:GDYXXLXY domain-containing protein [Endomicrobiia bacterium]MCL2799520.1 GDYXXLXY domain-containing protein [Endomicrobiia bacterium]
MNRKKAFLILMSAWFLLAASFVIYKEYNLRFGKSVMLKVVPVDPRDLFRGDYVILDYEISRKTPEQKILGHYGEYIEDEEVTNGGTVYVSLIKDGKFYKGGDIYRKMPEEGLFIKGKIDKKRNNFTIIYGIENFFVPENKGLELEKERNANNMSAEIIITSRGAPAIKNLYVNGKKVDFKNNEKNN